MKFDPDKHHRRSVRLRGYDYSRPGAYFVTVCSYQRADVFGEFREESISLTKAGRIALDWWEKIPSKFENVVLDQFIIMPDHLHGIINLVGADPCVRPGYKLTEKGGHMGPPLPKMIQWFKTMSTNEYLRNIKKNCALDCPPKLWQRNYYEHIIRNESELAEIREYVTCNPLKLSALHI